MSRHEGLSATYIPAMLIDHPVTSDRIAEARARASQFAPRKEHDSQSYELIRERVRVLTTGNDIDLAAVYQRKIDRGEATLADRYALALTLMEHRRAEEAVKILTQLTHDHEGLILLHIALGQAQAKAGDMKDALATFARAETLFPRNVPVTVRYAETLMADNKAGEAHTMLLDLFNVVPPTPDQIRLTALAASAAGDAADAYFYMGEYQLAGGDLSMAQRQLLMALATPHITNIQRERYQARLDEIREYLMSLHKRQIADNGDSQPQQQQQGRGHYTGSGVQAH